MDTNKALYKAITDAMDNVGLDIELSTNFDKNFFNVVEEAEAGNIRTYVRGEDFDGHMLTYVFSRMLKDNEVTIVFNENTTEKNKKYLEKLVNSITKEDQNEA